MYEILIATQAIVLLITVLGCIPYGIWVIYSSFKRKWKRVALQVAIPLAVYATLAGISALCSSRIHADYLSGLYDVDISTLGTPLFEHDSERSFNGDGYSISIFELPDSIRQRFESPDEKLLTQYPKHPSYRNHWKFEHWREAPFDSRFQNQLDFALNSYSSEASPELASHFESIRKSLTRKGTYYAFFYNDPSGYIGDIDFFIIDLIGGRMYSINFNT